jgi:hypothetical protein
MTKQLEGVVMCAKFEKLYEGSWTDPVNGQVKPYRSFKVLLPNGDGTVTRESISVPMTMRLPELEEGKAYALACTVSLNKKKQTLSWTLRSDVPPFPAPEIG